jgi:hypothetical protein
MTDSPLPAVGKKYRLLIYRNIARRYFPAALVLVLFGLLLQAPRFAPEIIPPGFLFGPDSLSVLGAIALIMGIVVYVASLREGRRGFVQCHREYLLINTASGRVAVAYPRVVTSKPVAVRDLYPTKKEKGRNRAIIKPLAHKNALELIINEYPLPEKEIRRRLHRFVFTPRDTGFLFILERPGELNVEIMKYQDALRRTQRDEELSKFRGDPITRMQNQSR